MARAPKALLLFGLKLTLLAAILAWAGARVRLEDSLVPASSASPGPAGAGALRVLAVEHEDPQPAPGSAGGSVPQAAADGQRPVRAFIARDAGGQQVRIPGEEVDGAAPRWRHIPGARSLFRELHWGYTAVALLLMGLPALLIGLRWLLLLRTAGVELSLGQGLRLHFIGLFFNTFMPGGTGGDVIKAVAISRATRQTPEAISMILVDRAIGMLVLLLMPAITLLLRPAYAPGVARTVGLTLAAMLIGVVLYYAAPFRRLTRWETLRAYLPRFVTRIDEAAYGLRRNPGVVLAALAASFAAQLIGVTAALLAGRALGIHAATWADYFLIVPVALLANALPISFGGLGLMEGAFLALFTAAGLATATQGFMLGLLVRGLMLSWALPGGLVALFARWRSEKPDATGQKADLERRQLPDTGLVAPPGVSAGFEPGVERAPDAPGVETWR